MAAAAGAGVFFAALPFFTFALFLKPLAQEFSWSRESVSSAFSSMMLGAALSAPIVGYFFDRFGSRWISGSCLAINGLGLASLCFLTPRVWHLYAVYTVVGLATAGTSGVVYARAVSSWFERRRGAALAAVLACTAVGGIVHPPVAAALIGWLGWRSASLALGLVSVAIGVPIVLRFVRSATRAHEKTVASGLTVAEAVSSRVFWILITVVFSTTIALNGTIVHLAAMLTDRGFSSSAAALVVSIMGGTSLAGRLLTGAMLDRFAASRVSFMLLAIAAFGTFALADARSFMAAALAAGCIGFGTGGEFDVVPYLLSRHFGLRSLSTLYGLNWTVWGAASAAGPMLMGRAFDTTGSYGTVLVAFAAGTLAAGVLMLAVPRVVRPQALPAP